MGKLLLAIGLLGLCHAAYSATQHRIYLRLTEQEFSSLPKDIILQTVASLFLCAFSILNIVGKFKQIKIASEWETKNWDNIGNRVSFYSFNHRGKYLFSDKIPQQQQQELLEDNDSFEEEDEESELSSESIEEKIGSITIKKND
jgi:hypothetical protein